ncbi:MAG: AAA family ATPase, partial [Rubrobacteraceae bacterium]
DIDGLVSEHNRSVFLNEMDGFASNDGLLVVASSNHPEKLDEALLKRPSRFDRVFHLGLPDLEVREEHLGRLFSLPALVGRLEFPEETARRVAGITGGFTPAHIKEAVLSAALEFAHEEIEEDFEEAVVSQVESLRAYLKLADAPGKLGETRVPTRPGF